MAIKTDTVAYTNTPPWRGQGVSVNKGATVAQMLKAAKLDWKVEKVPLTGPEGDEVPGHFGLRRSTDRHYFDVCGSRYIPTQNADALGFFNDFVKAGDATLELVGSLAGGSIVWGLAKLDQEFELPGSRKDKVRGYLFLGSPHIQGRSLVARMTTLRDVCNNTLSIAMRKGKNGFGDTFRMNHRNEFNEVQQDEARRVLKLAREQVKQFADDAARLAKKKMTDSAAEDFFKDIFGDGPRADRVIDAYRNAPGAMPGTAWGALNAVTYYSDHLASRTPEKRLANAWMGRTMRQKEQAFNTLLDA